MNALLVLKRMPFFRTAPGKAVWTLFALQNWVSIFRYYSCGYVEGEAILHILNKVDLLVPGPQTRRSCHVSTSTNSRPPVNLAKQKVSEALTILSFYTRTRVQNGFGCTRPGVQQSSASFSQLGNPSVCSLFFPPLTEFWGASTVENVHQSPQFFVLYSWKPKYKSAPYEKSIDRIVFEIFFRSKHHFVSYRCVFTQLKGDDIIASDCTSLLPIKIAFNSLTAELVVATRAVSVQARKWSDRDARVLGANGLGECWVMSRVRTRYSASFIRSNPYMSCTSVVKTWDRWKSIFFYVRGTLGRARGARMATNDARCNRPVRAF